MFADFGGRNNKNDRGGKETLPKGRAKRRQADTNTNRESEVKTQRVSVMYLNRERKQNYVGPRNLYK